MFKLRRIIHLNSKISDDWIQSDIKLDNNYFYLMDSEMAQLKKAQEFNEYDYYDYDNVLHLDKTPEFLSQYIGDDFLDDYAKHLGDKHYVSYYFSYMEEYE